MNSEDPYIEEKDPKRKENLRIWRFGARGPPHNTQNTHLAKTRNSPFCTIPDLRLPFVCVFGLWGSLLGSVPSALFGVLEGSEGGEGGPRGSIWGFWSVFEQFWRFFLYVRIFGIHPQNNQDIKNKVYITSTITRAIKLDTFRLYVIKTNGLKTFIFYYLNFNLFLLKRRPPGQGGKFNYLILLLLSITNDPR